MEITAKTLEDIAHLSRLYIKQENEGALLNDLSKILSWMEKLNEIDTSQVEPLIHISTEMNILRQDEVQASLDHEKGLLNAPKRDSNYFRVPKVIE